MREGALSSSAINSIINAVNSFTRYLNTTGKITLDYTVERPEEDVSEPTILTIQEIKHLYDATFLSHRNDNLAIGQRERCVIAVFYGCGLRKMEGTTLNLGDIDLNRKLGLSEGEKEVNSGMYLLPVNMLKIYVVT